MAETDKHLCCVRCRECDLVTNPYDACTGMTEQERAAALVARSRRMSRHRRQRTQRSGSGGSGTSVADSVGSRRESCSLDFGRRGKRQIRMLLAYAGRGIGGPSRSPAGDRSGLDVRSSGHPDPGRVERSCPPGSREDLTDPSLVESVTSRSTGDRTMVPVVRSSGSGLLTGPTDQSVRRVRSTGPVDRSGDRSGLRVRSAGPVDRSGPPVRSTGSVDRSGAPARSTGVDRFSRPTVRFFGYGVNGEGQRDDADTHHVASRKRHHHGRKSRSRVRRTSSSSSSSSDDDDDWSDRRRRRRGGRDRRHRRSTETLPL